MDVSDEDTGWVSLYLNSNGSKRDLLPTLGGTLRIMIIWVWRAIREFKQPVLQVRGLSLMALYDETSWSNGPNEFMAMNLSLSG